MAEANPGAGSKKGLDNGSALTRIGDNLSAMPGCEHKHTEFLMRRDGVDYVGCKDCGQVFEADDLEQVPLYEDEEEPRQKRAS